MRLHKTHFRSYSEAAEYLRIHGFTFSHKVRGAEHWYNQQASYNALLRQRSGRWLVAHTWQ